MNQLALQALQTARQQIKTNHLSRKLVTYRFDPAAYIHDFFHWTPWRGDDVLPGQQEICDAYTLALRQQVQRQRYEHGDPFDATIWQPDQPIRNILRIEAGHTVGKTKLAAGLVNHFFDTWPPAIIYTFAPSWEQIHDLLWKEIKADRRGRQLPGRIMDIALTRADNHFAKGRATNDAGGRGTERIQGQHGAHLMFVLDEAEGVADFVYDAVDSMASGGLVIVILLANPRTRTSRFHKLRIRPTVANFRISCLAHPNVRQDRDVIPGAVRRAYVTTMLDDHATQVEQHDPDAFTFSVPWQPGVIYRPDAEFMFRVLGMAPPNSSHNTLIPSGRYQAAVDRKTPTTDGSGWARIGVDCARYGNDFGTIYLRHNGTIRRTHQLAQANTLDYAANLVTLAQHLAARGVVSLHIRIDAGGGYGAGVIDQLVANPFLHLFQDLQIWEVHFNGEPYDEFAYADLATEMYANAAEALTHLRIEAPPPELEGDLTERQFRWTQRKGLTVKRLEPKEDDTNTKGFRSRLGRSPDDGDGCVLALAPDYLFSRPTPIRSNNDARVTISPL